MPVRSELPFDASISKKIIYPIIRALFFFLFGKLSYGRIQRVNKPDLRGPLIWSSSHSNFLCDAVMPIYEAPRPAKYLAKASLFRGPFKRIFEFLGGLPVVRAEDLKTKGDLKSSLNRSTFKAAIEALKDGWPIAIFPEGTSIPSPGLVLPLKAGVAKLAFAAEDANDFSLGLRIIPVGLEYGSRVKVGSGVTIRYGNPILVNRYREIYYRSSEEAVRLVLEELTKEMISVFPHFENEHMQNLGKKLFVSGLAESKHEAAQMFLRKRGDVCFEQVLSNRIRQLEEKSKLAGIPFPSWGYHQQWKNMNAWQRILNVMVTILGVPVAIWHLAHNLLPEYMLRGAVEFVAGDETEEMTVRFIAAPILLPLIYAFQFSFLKRLVPEITTGDLFVNFFAYMLLCMAVWFSVVYWKHNLKLIFSLLFFTRKRNAASAAVSEYQELQNFLKP